MVPKQRQTKSRSRKRRSHHALKKIVLSKCQKCSQPVLPHRVCQSCGFYKGKEVIDVMAKLSKRQRKKAEKAQKKQKKIERKQKPRAPLSLENLSKKHV